MWLSGNNPIGLNDAGRSLVEYLRGVARDGLNPAVYAVPESASPALIETALSSALIRYAEDVGAGRGWRHEPEKFILRDPPDLLGVLNGAATVTDISTFADTLAPSAPEYRGLRRALASYRRIADAGGWNAIVARETIKPGHTGAEVAGLWQRLRTTGDIDQATPLPDTYGELLQQGVIRFQTRHGLAADGVVGRKTLAALNETVETRIRQIELNMERRRWMPDDLGETHIFVNLAGFELRAVRRGAIVESMPVIVGRPFRETPVFSDRISYMELNPTWTVPYKIATQDILPKLQSDPSYLSKNGFEVIHAGSATAVDPARIDWNRFGRTNFPYQLRQQPGPLNALGQVKFMFPNKYAVYLHDSPARDLFAKDVRMFSSGCIRVERPIALAQFLLANDATWQPDRLHREVETGKTLVIRLRQTVPVHLSYITAWVDNDGKVQFRDDVYRRDARLAAVLYRENHE